MTIRPFVPAFMPVGILTAALQELTPRAVRDEDPDRAIEDWLDFARELVGMGVELVSTGGTASILHEAGLPVTDVASVTGAPGILDGRVKTLHPAVHGGILARRDVPADLEELVAAGIGRIDLVCVGLYPFERVVAGLDPEEGEAIEMIDVGGPALLRAAAKNHAHVAAVCRVEDYEPVLDQVRATGGVSPELRRQLALRAFATTAAYDGQIAAWLGRDQPFPETFTPVFDRVLELPYVLHNVAKGSSAREAFVARAGKMMVPYLVDPNTGAAMFESAEIVRYLDATYALPPS